MVAPGVASVIVTDCADEYAPCGGDKTGGSACNAYVAAPTPLLGYPGARAIALTVSEFCSRNGPVYKVEFAVGVLPSVV